MSYRPDRRDPLTYRWSHSVRDTLSDPFDYSEGASEPEYLAVDEPPDHPVDRLIVRWGPMVMVAVIVAVWKGWL